MPRFFQPPPHVQTTQTVRASDDRARPQPTDLELAALISSKICHDVIGPVGAIYNGLEILDEDDDAEAKNYALDVIRNVTEQASARLQFARFAFGAAGSAGAQIDLATAEQISRGLIGNKGKHKLAWRGLRGQMAQGQGQAPAQPDRQRRSRRCRAAARSSVTIAGSLEQPSFLLRCRGPGARPPQYLADYVARRPAAQPRCLVDPGLLHVAAGGLLAHARSSIAKEGADIALIAKRLCSEAFCRRASSGRPAARQS